MPTQWRTIAPIVGRTATQCLERYQKLLDDAEAKENEELGLGGPEGGETAAPSADDVRRLRPGELDPDPESKPAKPDTIDLDEDEKEMLSEARARLANTQGKKAKRKARERQLEESRRVAQLQKRRELKQSGINIKLTSKKKGQMDYNADIPFEKGAAPGFYDTVEEAERNEKQREAFDPRKQQLANKRKGDPQDEDPSTKRRKGDNKNSVSAAAAAAARAGQMQRMREAEQQGKRRALVLPAPQVGESELEDIVKMGMTGHQASQSAAAASDNEATKGFIGDYSGMVGATPIRTPRAPPQEDRVANEIRNIRALTNTQSSLLGGENTPLHTGAGSTGFEGAKPTKHVTATPNPMATPLRSVHGQTYGVSATPIRGAPPGATPLRTPRDTFALNQNDQSAPSSTPLSIRSQSQTPSSLRAQLASLPKPQLTEWELELPDEQPEPSSTASTAGTEEDAAIRDERARKIREAQEQAELKRRTQVIQRGLPRPLHVDYSKLMAAAKEIENPAERLIAEEAALLITHDALRYPIPGGSVTGTESLPPLPPHPSDENLQKARLAISREMLADPDLETKQSAFAHAWEDTHQNPSARLPGTSLSNPTRNLPGLSPSSTLQDLTTAFQTIQTLIEIEASRGTSLEKKLKLQHGGYLSRGKVLREKIQRAWEALGEEKRKLRGYEGLLVEERGVIEGRREGLRGEKEKVEGRVGGLQEVFRGREGERERVGVGMVNGR